MPLEILVADGYKTTQLLSQITLEKVGCKVDTVFSAAETIEKIGQKDYDIVVMEIKLAGPSDGIEALKQIRALKTLKKQPYIVMFTVKYEQEFQDLCFEAGADDFLPRRLELNALVDFVKKKRPECF